MTSTLAPRSLVPSSGPCFHCRGATVTAAVPGEPPVRCVTCGSAWFSLATFLAAGRGELRPIDDALLAMAPRASAPPRTAFRDACHADQGDGGCPHCERPLRRAPVHEADVVVEVCDDHGVGVRGEDVHRIRQAAGIQAALHEVAVSAAADAPRPHWPSRVVLGAGVALFVASLFLPSVHLWRDVELPGLACLALSVALVPEQPLALLCVLGNLLMIALPAVGPRLRGPTAIAGSAVVFGAMFGGLALDGTHARVGYRVWMASLVVVALGLLVRAPLRAR